MLRSCEARADLFKCQKSLSKLVLIMHIMSNHRRGRRMVLVYSFNVHRVHRAAEGWPPLASQYIRDFVSMSVSAEAPVCILMEAKCTIDYNWVLCIYLHIALYGYL